MATLVVAFEFSPPEIEAANWKYVRKLPEFLCSLESAHYFPSTSLFLSLTKMKSSLSTEGHQPIINQVLNILVHTEENGDRSVFFPPVSQIGRGGAIHTFLRGTDIKIFTTDK